MGEMNWYIGIVPQIYTIYEHGDVRKSMKKVKVETYILVVHGLPHHAQYSSQTKSVVAMQVCHKYALDATDFDRCAH